MSYRRRPRVDDWNKATDLMVLNLGRSVTKSYAIMLAFPRSALLQKIKKKSDIVTAQKYMGRVSFHPFTSIFRYH